MTNDRALDSGSQSNHEPDREPDREAALRDMALIYAADAHASGGTFSFRMMVDEERNIAVDTKTEFAQFLRGDPEVGGHESTYLLVKFDHDRGDIALHFDLRSAGGESNPSPLVAAQTASDVLGAAAGVLERLELAFATLRSA